METKIDQVSFSDVTVVMYHYVRHIKKSSYKNIKGLETKSFINQIKYLRKNYNIIRIEDLIDSIKKKSQLPSKALLLTFDDGYSDHFHNVFPVLKKPGKMVNNPMIWRVTEKVISQDPVHPNALAVTASSLEYAALGNEQWFF